MGSQREAAYRAASLLVSGSWVDPPPPGGSGVSRETGACAALTRFHVKLQVRESSHPEGGRIRILWECESNRRHPGPLRDRSRRPASGPTRRLSALAAGRSIGRRRIGTRGRGSARPTPSGGKPGDGRGLVALRTDHSARCRIGSRAPWHPPRHPPPSDLGHTARSIRAESRSSPAGHPGDRPRGDRGRPARPGRV